MQIEIFYGPQLPLYTRFAISHQNDRTNYSAVVIYWEGDADHETHSQGWKRLKGLSGRSRSGAVSALEDLWNRMDNVQIQELPKVEPGHDVNGAAPESVRQLGIVMFSRQVLGFLRFQSIRQLCTGLFQRNDSHLRSSND